jgi:hypothetical protein
MTMLLALLLSAVGPTFDEPPTFEDIPLPTSLSEEQDTRSRERDDSSSSTRREPSQKFILSLGIEGRFSFPFGYANRDVAAVSNGGGVTLLFDGHFRWNDVFNNGWGTSIIAEITMMQTGRGGGEGRGRGKFSMGGYVGFSQDHFGGDNVGDGHGNTIKVDDMTMNTYLVGGTMYQALGDGWFTDGRLGIGAVHYSQVDAEYHFKFNPVFTSGFLEDSWNFATEFKGGGGYRAGPFAFTLGIGVRMLFPPSEAGAISIEQGILWTFDIVAGVEIGF